MSNEQRPPLEDQFQDRLTFILKAISGTVDVVASNTVTAAFGVPLPIATIFAEIVGHLVPRQRLERLGQFVYYLHQQLPHTEDELRKQMQHPANLDLFEEGAMHSARALTTERIQYISRLVAKGISGKEADQLASKRLLNLMQEIDDEQIIILASFLTKNLRDADFQSRHLEALEPLAMFNSEEAEHDKVAIKTLATDHLIRLGLLKQCFEKPPDGIPEWDFDTGMIRATYRPRLTQIGRMLLRHTGLANEQDV